MAVLDELQSAIAEAAERVGPSVVGLGRGWGLGSGVVIGEGRVLTSAHVLRREEATVTFAAGRRATGQVAGVDADLDVAVLSIDTGDAPPVAWEPDATGAPGVGAPVIALADPGGRGLRATLGFVTAAGRRFRGPRGRQIGGAIEHSAPLPRGSSGGPLVDPVGRLLGINAIRLEGGLILALPADAALRERVDLLARGEAPPRRRLGVAAAPPRIARKLRAAVGLPERDGVLVRAVEDGSPAGRAGLQRGDLIVGAAGAPVDGIDALHAALDAVPAGGDLALDVLRATEELTVTVTFGAEPAEVA
jgi:serine protease Do